ncbi:amino acid adenylation domain-containing protein [Gordonia phosphorivorans]|uniref:amino acid adenylation domain-containing protein n=1 Tax=Gordonia phosphorivorans TaxID=1056982 RepID=UPI00360A6F86
MLLPLTAPQRGIWFAETLSQDYSVNIAQCFRISHAAGALDIELLADCTKAVGKLLEAPYIRFSSEGDVPCQYVDLDFPQEVGIHDFRNADDPENAVDEWIAEDQRRTVDMWTDQLVVAELLIISDECTLWYQRAHHIVCDGSAAIAIALRIIDRYNAIRRGEEPDDRPALTLAEIAKYDEDYLDSGRRLRDREHWQSRIAEMPEPVTLARSAAKPALAEAIVVRRSLDAAFEARLAEVSSELNSYQAALLTAAFAAFMARMCGTDDVVLSLPVTGRTTKAIRESAGMLSNIVPIRLRGLEELTVRQVATAAQIELTGALRHQRYRTEDIRREAGLDPQKLYFGPAINMMFFDELSLDEATIDYRVLSTGIIEDLAINLYQPVPGAPMTIDLQANPSLYRLEEIEDHLDRFLRFADRMYADLDRRIPAIELTSVREAEWLAAVEEGPSHPTGDMTYLLADFERQVATNPEATALVLGTREISYGEFGARVAALARELVDQGVGAERAVALCMPRSVEMMVAIYAIISAGGHYVPIDPEAPAERIGHMLATAQAGHMLISRHHSESEAAAAARVGGVPMVEVDSTGPVDVDLQPLPVGDRGVFSPDCAAYALFTSGSTGAPKGVVLTHRAVLNRLYWGISELGLAPHDRVVQKTPYTFDCSVPELFAPLMVGATLVLLKDRGHIDAEYVADEISRTEATMVHFVPSILSVFLEANDEQRLRRLDSIRMISVTGEALPPAVAAEVRRIWPSVDFYNLYGPTEAAIEITSEEIRELDSTNLSVPIGRPVWNSAARVLGSRLERLPNGVPGELYLAGVQLARGYADRADLSAERFVADPYGGPGQRMYRTGDLVRRLPDGRLEYLGRTDFQVKLRGQRIELGEIESVISSVPGVVHTAVTVAAAPGGAEHLVAYLAGVGRDSVVLDAVKAEAVRALPGYMVPSVWMVLDDIQLNSAGKLDRKSLPAPDFRTEVHEYLAPESAVEITLTDIIQEMLGARLIGMGDNLFELGADSLSAARLRAKMHAAGFDLALTDIFGSRTIADLAVASTPSSEKRLPLRPRERSGGAPLSNPQSRLWFINRLDPEAPTYNMPGVIRWRAEVDGDAFRQAIADVLKRHEILRTVYPTRDGDPVQAVLSVAEAVARVPVRTSAVTAAELESQIFAEVVGGFDLVSDLPVRFALLRVLDGVETEYALVCVLHHIAGDGYSLRPLISDLITAYTARCEGRAPQWKPLPVQYADFTLWQNEMLGEPDDPASRSSREVGFWREQLGGAPDLLALPTDFARPAVPSGRGAFVDAVLPHDIVAGIRSLAVEHGVTPFTVLHVAVATVLGRLAGTSDVSIGTPIAGRDEPETSDMVGMFVNTVVLRSALHPETTVGDALTASGQIRTRAMEHSQVAFEKIVDAVVGQRTLAHNPLFQVSLTLGADYREPLERLGAEFSDGRIAAAKYDLAIDATETIDLRDASQPVIELEFNYSTDLFTEARIEDLAGYVRSALRSMIEDPARTLGSIDLIPVEEIERLTRAPSKIQARTLRELVRAGAALADPTSPAVVGTRTIPRDEFSARTAQVARTLIAKGVGPGDVVALAIPRSDLSVLATAAVIETGAAFVSIDVRDPLGRRRVMLADSGATVGVAAVESQSAAGELPELDWLVLGDARDEAVIGRFSAGQIRDEELRRPVRLDDIAYIIHTSGSTGTPKATQVPNRGLANLIAAESKFLSLTPQSRVLHVSSPTFDASILELTMAWGAGATQVVADLNTYAGSELASLIDRHQVSHLFLTPSVLATIDPESVPTLRHVLGGGEANPPELVRRWTAAGRRYINIYGPTETTVWTTVDVFTRPEDDVTIGTGLPGVGTLVLDGGLRPVPVGVAGELYLVGDQVTLGYRGMPGLTASRFVANPFDRGQRMYRTGDRVQWRADGRLDYLGRTDHQLKIRGLRIEPGEVDAAMLRHPAVANSLTLGVARPGGETMLATYVSLVSGAAADEADMLRHARTLLPGHLVPQALQVIDEFPRTLTGKVNRGALPDFTPTVDREYVAPRTEREAVVAEVFAQYLGLDRVSVTAGFFEMGGNSLAAVKLAGALSGVTGQHIPVKALLEASSVEAIAAYAESSDTERVALPLRPRPHPEHAPISEVQRGMWLLNRLDPDSPAYNIAFALRLSGTLDAAAVRAAAADLVERQATLRTYYPMVGGDPCQRVVPAAEAVAALDFEMVEATDSALDVVRDVVRRGFDVTQAPPFRMALVRLGPAEHIVVFVMHHISADGSSLRPLAQDFIAAALARAEARIPALPPLRVDYVDFALWQAERLNAVGAEGISERDRQLAYWQGRLRGAPDQLRLPSDRPRSIAPSFAGDTVEFKIPAELVAALELIARSHDGTLFDVVHAAYAVFLGRMAGVDDVVIGTAFAGRTEPALDSLVGMFVNSLPLRTILNANETFGDLVERVHAEDMEDMSNADIAFEAVVEGVGVRRSSAFNPVFQAMLLFQNFEMPVVEVPGLTIAPVDEGLTAGQVDLQLSVFPTDPLALGSSGTGGPMRANFVYATDLFDASTIEQYAGRFLAVLEAVAGDPMVTVGDISIATDSDGYSDDDDAAQRVALPDLVESGANQTPEAVAVRFGASTITFGELWATTTAMAVSIPDRDSALVTALMSLAPELAAAGPEGLSSALSDIRSARVDGQ